MGCGISESLIENKVMLYKKTKNTTRSRSAFFIKKKKNYQVRTKCKTFPGGPNRTGNLVSVYDKRPDEKIF